MRRQTKLNVWVDLIDRFLPAALPTFRVRQRGEGKIVQESFLMNT